MTDFDRIIRGVREWAVALVVVIILAMLFALPYWLPPLVGHQGPAAPAAAVDPAAAEREPEQIQPRAKAVDQALDRVLRGKD